MIQKTSIPSTKGKLAAVIHYPKEKTKRLAILCPGFLDTKDYAHLVALADALAKRGYTVVRFDPTGTWGSEGDISEYTTTQYLTDIKKVLEFMLKKGKYTHVLLGGHSRGGMVSILYAARDPRISLVLGIMPSSGRTMIGPRRTNWRKTGFSISKRDVPGNKNKTMTFRVPYTHAKDRDQYDVVRDVKKIKVPILLIAGELDDLVLPEDVKEIFNHANKPKKFILIPDIGHDYRHNKEEVKLVNKHALEQLSAL